MDSFQNAPRPHELFQHIASLDTNADIIRQKFMTYCSIIIQSFPSFTKSNLN